MESPQPPDVLPYQRTPEPIPLASFTDAGEARMAAAKVEADGIPCAVVDHAALNGFTAGGATIAVEEEHFQRAVEVLSKTPAQRCLLVRQVEPLKETDPVPPPAGLIARLLARLGIMSSAD